MKILEIDVVNLNFQVQFRYTGDIRREIKRWFNVVLHLLAHFQTFLAEKNTNYILQSYEKKCGGERGWGIYNLNQINMAVMF